MQVIWIRDGPKVRDPFHRLRGGGMEIVDGPFAVPTCAHVQGCPIADGQLHFRGMISLRARRTR